LRAAPDPETASPLPVTTWFPSASVSIVRVFVPSLPPLSTGLPDTAAPDAAGPMETIPAMAFARMPFSSAIIDHEEVESVARTSATAPIPTAPGDLNGVPLPSPLPVARDCVDPAASLTEIGMVCP
jgi:hypothetical protein